MMAKEEERDGACGGKQEFRRRLESTNYVRQKTVLSPAVHAALKTPM